MRARSWRAALLRLRAAIATAPVKRFVAISEFVRRQMQLLGFDDARISVVHKGIPLDRYAPDLQERDRLIAEYSIERDAIILGTVAVMRAFKHPEVILKACSLLAARGVAFRLFMCGDGELKPEMERLAARIGIASRVHWLGYLSQPEVFMRGWDLFLLASEGEAFGFVLIEAMACGSPIVAAASGGITEVVDHGRTGFLTPVLDAKAMADCIEMLARDGSLRRAMSSAAIQRVRDHFALEASVQKTLRVYESMW
jgi:L-malate glycosyltransferase